MSDTRKYSLSAVRSKLQTEVMTDPEVKELQDQVMSGKRNKDELVKLIYDKYIGCREKYPFAKTYSIEALAPSIVPEIQKMAMNKSVNLLKNTDKSSSENEKVEDDDTSIKSDKVTLSKDQIILNIIKSKLPPVLSLNVPKIEFEGCSFGTKVWSSSLKVAKGRADNLLNKERLIVLQVVGEVLKEYCKEDD